MSSNILLIKIESMIPFLSKTDQKIANYILCNPNESVIMSTKDLATACKVSEPSIIRFTRKLGFSGFKEFKIRLSASLGTKTEITFPNNIEKNDTPSEIYDKLSAYAISSIKSSRNTLDKVDFQYAINLIIKANENNNTIFLSGMGSSSVSIRNLRVKLMRLNIQSIFYEDIHLRLEACTNLNKGDLLICITTLGSAIENYQIIDIAKKRGADIIVITQYGNTKIAEKATVTLYTSVSENDSRLISHSSFIVQNIIIDTIFFSIASKNYDEIIANVQQSRIIFNEFGHYAYPKQDKYIKE